MTPLDRRISSTLGDDIILKTIEEIKAGKITNVDDLVKRTLSNLALQEDLKKLFSIE